MNDEKFVLFLDILGFKDLIYNNTADEVKDIYNNQVIKTIGPALQLASLIYGFPLTLSHVVTPKHTLEDTIQELFEIHIMSDSVIIWTKDNSNETLIKFFSFTSVFLSMTFIMGVQLRGAISIGDVSELRTAVNNIVQSCVVGKGIVNAYSLEGKQNWMGCIVDEKCLKNIPIEQIELLISKKNSSLVRYNVPIKTKNKKGKIIFDSEMNYVINWTNAPGIIEDDINFFKDNFSRFNKNIETKDVENKIKNTFNFYQAYK